MMAKKGFPFILLLAAFLLNLGKVDGQIIQARNLLEEGELLEAKKYADQAVEEEEGKKKARAWYYRGKIHYDLFRSSDEEHREHVEKNGADVAIKAVKSYLKAWELDEEGKFEDRIKKELPVVKSALLNKGVQIFNRRNYEKAFQAFDLGVRAGERLNDGEPTDTLAYFNGGLAARQLGKNDRALEMFRTSIELGNEAAKSYFIISRIHKERGDMEKAFEVIKKGREEHPEFRKLVLEELDHFIRRGDYQKAKKRLEKAIEENPRNGILHFSLGTVYDRLYQKSDSASDQKIGGKDSTLFTNAKEHYDRALSFDSTLHSAYYSLGALYYNRGADVLNRSNTLKGQAKYEDEIEEAEKDLERAKPYLEKALKIKPNDKETLISLRNLYDRMGKKEKADEMDQRLKN